MREQNLSRTDAALCKATLIHLRQPHLTDCGSRLKLIDLTWSLGPPETLHAFGNRTRTHEHDFLAPRAQLGNLLRPSTDGFMVESPTIIGDQTRSDFYDEPFGIGYHRPHVCPIRYMNCEPAFYCDASAPGSEADDSLRGAGAPSRNRGSAASSSASAA